MTGAQGEAGHLTGYPPALARLRQELAPELDVLGHIGSGSGAEVYLARDVALDRLVAVKVLSANLTRDGVALARFQREAKAAASLNHPNVVAVYRTGSLSNGSPYLVMQYVHGPNLEQRLAAEGPLSVHEARVVLAQVAAALAAAHKHGFAHRDVRPSNILCDTEQQRVLVGDFGLAGILADANRTNPHLTLPGQILGDLKYLSPEQIRGQQAVEGSDIYSLGVLGYEILTGGAPWANVRGPAAVPTPGARPIPLASVRPEVDPQLASLLERALANEPDRRPGAAFLAEALNRKPDAATASPAEPLVPFNLLNALIQRRLPQIVAVTGVFGLAVLGVFDMLADRAILPEVVFRLVLATIVCLLAASAIVAWFHGQRGDQKVKPLEIVLLAAIGVIWMAMLLLVLSA